MSIGIYRAFFDEVGRILGEKTATILFSANSPPGLDVKPVPTKLAPLPAPSAAAASIKPISLQKSVLVNRPKGSTGGGISYVPGTQAIRERHLTLAQLPNEVQRRYGNRAPMWTAAMQAQAHSAGQAIEAAGVPLHRVQMQVRSGVESLAKAAPLKQIKDTPSTSLGPRSTLSASVGEASPAVLGHELGHLHDVANYKNPKLYNTHYERNFVPQEISATEHALAAGRDTLSRADIASLLSGTSSYLEDAHPPLRRSLRRTEKIIEADPLTVRRQSHAEQTQNAVKRLRSQKSPHVALAQRLNESASARAAEERLNPFTTKGFGPKAVAATKKHVNQVASVLGKFYDDAHVEAYRQHMHERLAQPGVQAARVETPMSRAAPAVAAAAEKGLPAWGSSLRRAASVLKASPVRV